MKSEKPTSSRRMATDCFVSDGAKFASILCVAKNMSISTFAQTVKNGAKSSRNTRQPTIEMSEAETATTQAKV
jgi:hypothetical protein